MTGSYSGVDVQTEVTVLASGSAMLGEPGTTTPVPDPWSPTPDPVLCAALGTVEPCLTKGEARDERREARNGHGAVRHVQETTASLSRPAPPSRVPRPRITAPRLSPLASGPSTRISLYSLIAETGYSTATPTIEHEYIWFAGAPSSEE